MRDDHSGEFPLYAFALTPDGLLREISNSWSGLTGHGQDVIGSHWVEIMQPAEQQALRENWSNWTDLAEADSVLRRADGEALPVHVTLQRTADGWRGYLTPQRQQMRMGRHVQQLEARIDALFRTGSQSIVILDLNHRVLDFNQIAAETAWLRFHREIRRGDHFVSYVQPDRLEDFYESFQQVLQGRHVFKERVIYAPDRQGYTYEMSYTPIYDDSGRIDSVCFAMVNVEHQRQIRLLLNHEQSFVTSILNATNALIVVIDRQGKIVRFNKACERITGYRSDEVCDSVFWDVLVTPEEQARVRDLYQGISENSQLNNVQFRLRDRQGKSHFISWSLSMMLGLKEDTLYVVSTGIDVTDRLAAEQALQQSEAMLRQAQKMEAVGQLAGGIAHDFNNMLTTIMGYGQLLEQRLTDAESREDLDEILKMCTKARDLTHQLLMFSRKAPAQAQPVRLSRLLGQMEGLLRQLLEERVQLLLELGEPGWIQANPLHLEQVVMNLVVNARDAISGPGVLRIALSRQHFAQDVLRPMFGRFAAGAYVCLSVADSGCGMSEETRACIFEPFFTTKERGKGTGLGLAVVYRIVREAGGWADVSSLPGQGSTFELFFPLLEQAPQEEPAGRLALYQLPDGQQQAIRHFLPDFAGGIESVSNPEQLQSLIESEKPPELLIAPLQHPRPQVGIAKVLYLAGDSAADMELLDRLGGQDDVLLAPFTSQQLRTRIRRMLEPSNN